MDLGTRVLKWSHLFDEFVNLKMRMIEASDLVNGSGGQGLRPPLVEGARRPIRLVNDRIGVSKMTGPQKYMSTWISLQHCS